MAKKKGTTKNLYELLADAKIPIFDPLKQLRAMQENNDNNKRSFALTDQMSARIHIQTLENLRGKTAKEKTTAISEAFEFIDNNLEPVNDYFLDGYTNAELATKAMAIIKKYFVI